MKNRSAWLLVALLALVLVWGVGAVYRLRVARGDLFPEYSTLRADPLGTRALHDAARLLPGRHVERWMRPFERFEAGEGDLVFVLGVRRDLDDESWKALDRAAIAGASVIVAWRAEASHAGDGAFVRSVRAEPWEEKPEAKPEPKEKTEDVEKPRDAEKKAEKRDEAEDGRRGVLQFSRSPSEHERRWGYRLLRRELITGENAPDAQRDPAAPDSWPDELARWRSDLFFLARKSDGWRPLYRRGGDIVMMERARGAGRVVLLADSFLPSNEAVHRDRESVILADLFGAARRVVFVETHLGVETDAGVAMLARRYGLGAAAVSALVLAALWFWRRASPLAPVPPEDAELKLVIAPTAGLEALLRRAIPPGKLHEACVEAWRGTASATDRRRLEQTAVSADTDPVSAHRAVARALSKRTLS
jgi:hypothetical protein